MDLIALSKLADSYVRARELRLAKEKEVEGFKEIETELKQKLLDTMEETSIHVVGGKLGIVKFKTSLEPTAKDWPQIYQYVKETNSFDILYRRLNSKAIKDRKEEGVEIPGLDWFPVASLSVSRGPVT